MSFRVDWLDLLAVQGTLKGLFQYHREIDGETVESVADFILGGSKITADGDLKLKDAYSLEGKL